MQTKETLITAYLQINSETETVPERTAYYSTKQQNFKPTEA